MYKMMQNVQHVKIKIHPVIALHLLCQSFRWQRLVRIRIDLVIGCGHTRCFYPVVSFQNNGLTTLLYVTALPFHIQRCYNVSFFRQESSVKLRCPKQRDKQGADMNYSVVKQKTMAAVTPESDPIII